MFFKKKKPEQNNKELIEYLEDFKFEMNARLQELKSMVYENKLTIESLDRKLFTKELKDKQLYGQLHYKIHEVRPKESKK